MEAGFVRAPRSSAGRRVRPRLYEAYRAAHVRRAARERPVRIGIDARELLGDTTGVGRYLGELLRRWTTRADAGTRRFVLYTPEPLRMAFSRRERARIA